MRIKKIVHQYRRDFTAIYACESCGREHRGGGYDDAFFHETVIPGMECERCGEKSTADYRPLAAKHPASATL